MYIKSCLLSSRSLVATHVQNWFLVKYIMCANHFVVLITYM